MSDDTPRGQDQALGLIRAALKTGHVGHAWLFHGPAGVGKTRAALWFGRAVLCDRPEADGAPCARCESCVAAAALRHPDLQLLVPLPTFRTEGRTERQAEEARSEARARVLDRYAREPWFAPIFSRPVVHSVEDLARAKEFLSLTARREGGWKVLVVKRAEAMTGPAAHVLEDPRGAAPEPPPDPVRAPAPGPPADDRLALLSRAVPAAPRRGDRRGARDGARDLPRGGAPRGRHRPGSFARAAAAFVPPMDGATKERPDENEFVRLMSVAVELFVHPKSSAVLGPLRRASRARPRALPRRGGARDALLPGRDPLPGGGVRAAGRPA